MRSFLLHGFATAHPTRVGSSSGTVLFLHRKRAPHCRPRVRAAADAPARHPPACGSSGKSSKSSDSVLLSSLLLLAPDTARGSELEPTLPAAASSRPRVASCALRLTLRIRDTCSSARRPAYISSLYSAVLAVAYCAHELP